MNPVRYPRGVQQAGEKGEAAHQRLLHLWREEEGTEKEITKQKKFFKTSPKTRGRAVDPHSFFADPDPAVLLNADSDPGAS